MPTHALADRPPDAYPLLPPPLGSQHYSSTPSRPPSRICPTPSRPLSNYPPPTPPPPQALPVYSEWGPATMPLPQSSLGSNFPGRPPPTPSPLEALPMYPPSSPSSFTSQLQFAASAPPYHTQHGIEAAGTFAPSSPPPGVPTSWPTSGESALDTSDFLEYTAWPSHPNEEASTPRFSPSFGTEHHIAHVESQAPVQTSPQNLANHTPSTNYSYFPW